MEKTLTSLKMKAMNTSSSQIVGPFLYIFGTISQNLGQVKKDTLESGYCIYLGVSENIGWERKEEFLLFTLWIFVLFRFFDNEHTFLI